MRNPIRRTVQLFRFLRAGLGRWEEVEEIRRRFPGASLAQDLVVRAPQRLSLGQGTRIEEGVYINCGEEWAPDGFFRCGEGCFIGAHSVIYAAGGVDLGANVGLGPHTLITSHRHAFGSGQGQHMAENVFQPVRIGDNAVLNMGATVLSGVTIGAGSVVGAQATVTRDVPPGVLVMGTPARIVRPL